MVVKINTIEEFERLVSTSVYTNKDAIHKLWKMLNECEVTLDGLNNWKVKPLYEFLPILIEKASKDDIVPILLDIIEWDTTYNQMLFDLLRLYKDDCIVLGDTSKVTKESLVMYNHKGV